MTLKWEFPKVVAQARDELQQGMEFVLRFYRVWGVTVDVEMDLSESG